MVGPPLCAAAPAGLHWRPERRETQDAAMPDSFDLPSLTRQVAAALPVAPPRLKLGGEPTGLVIVAEANGLATVGAGNLAPPTAHPPVAALGDRHSLGSGKDGSVRVDLGVRRRTK